MLKNVHNYFKTFYFILFYLSSFFFFCFYHFKSTLRILRNVNFLLFLREIATGNFKGKLPKRIGKDFTILFALKKKYIYRIVVSSALFSWLLFPYSVRFTTRDFDEIVLFGLALESPLKKKMLSMQNFT